MPDHRARSDLDEQINPLLEAARQRVEEAIRLAEADAYGPDMIIELGAAQGALARAVRLLIDSELCQNLEALQNRPPVSDMEEHIQRIMKLYRCKPIT